MLFISVRSRCLCYVPSISRSTSSATSTDFISCSSRSWANKMGGHGEVDVDGKVEGGDGEVEGGDGEVEGGDGEVEAGDGKVGEMVRWRQEMARWGRW